MKASNTIPSLDGLRAVSFLLVYAAHSGLDRVVPGGFGVTIFFFLSGFLITTLLRAEYDRRESLNLKHFWLRRALRILPPFYLVLVLSIVVSLLLGPPAVVSSGAVAAQLLHYTNYWMIGHGGGSVPIGTNVYWSLAVEEHFYLIFPWCYLAMRRHGFSGRQQAATLYAACAAVLLWRIALVMGLGASVDRTYLATDTRVDSILFGCALAVFNNPVADARRWPERAVKYVLLPGSLALLVACLLIRSPEFRETLRYSLQGIALTGVFTAALLLPYWGPFRLLNSRPLTVLGTLSYPLYLVHFMVLNVYSVLWPGSPLGVRAVASAAVSLLIAWLIHVLVERPAARLRHRYAA